MDNIEVNTIDAEVFKAEERCKKYTNDRLDILGSRVAEREVKQLDIIDGVSDNVLKLTHVVNHMNDKYSFWMLFLSIIVAAAIVAFVIVASISSSRINSLENEVQEYRTQIDSLIDETEIINNDDTVSFNGRAGITEVISNELSCR